MRLSLILAACIVLCGTMAVRADLLNVVDGGTVYSNMLSYSRVENATADYGGGQLDQVTITMTNSAAMDGGTLNALQGTFTCLSGMLVAQQYATYSGGLSGNYYNYMGNSPAVYVAGGHASWPASAVRNQDVTSNPGADWSETAGGNAGSADLVVSGEAHFPFPGYYYEATFASETAVTGRWSGTTTPNNNPLAVFFVHHGADLSFQSCGTGWGFNDSNHYQGGFTTAVPEPTTLLLLASGLAGVFGYARLRRRGR